MVKVPKPSDNTQPPQPQHRTQDNTYGNGGQRPAIAINQPPTTIMPSQCQFARRIEQITRQEALYHVNAAWDAQQRLMRRCLHLNSHPQNVEDVAQANLASPDELSVDNVIKLEEDFTREDWRSSVSNHVTDQTTNADEEKSLDSSKNDDTDSNSHNHARKKRKRPSVAEKSTRNIILQHFMNIHNKKKN
jgi:hypothetical protein